MSKQKRAVILIGSPKESNSSSEFIGDILIRLLCKNGVQTEKARIISLLKSQEGIEQLISLVDNSNIVIFSSPLYVDSLPYSVIKAMELLLENRKKIKEKSVKKFLAISNCGFPEAQQNTTAIKIYRQFAFEIGFNWAGGLAVGMGLALIICKPIEKISRIFYGVKEALKITADTLTEGKEIPVEAESLMAKPLMPIWLYTSVGNIRWIIIAFKNKALNMFNRPYRI